MDELMRWVKDTVAGAFIVIATMIVAFCLIGGFLLIPYVIAILVGLFFIRPGLSGTRDINTTLKSLYWYFGVLTIRLMFFGIILLVASLALYMGFGLIGSFSFGGFLVGVPFAALGFYIIIQGSKIIFLRGTFNERGGVSGYMDALRGDY